MNASDCVSPTASLGNVGGSPTPGNHTAETALAGWGGRIRTSAWRNQNPQKSFDMQRLSGLMLHLWQREESCRCSIPKIQQTKLFARRGEARQPEQLRV